MKVISVQNVQDKRRVLAGFDARAQTWLVADLKSKLEIQKTLLQREGFLEEDAVLRASELWRKLAQRQFPDWRFIGFDLCQVLLAERLSQSDLEWARTPGAADTLFHYIQQLTPILSHESGIEQLGPWLREHPDSALKWGHWAMLAHEFWQWFQKEKWLPGAWVKGLLVNADLSHAWPRRVVVDLGAELSFAELDLLKALDKNFEVLVLEPAMAQTGVSGAIYRELRAGAKKSETAAEPKWAGAVERYRTVVAEIKACTHWIRERLDSGVGPERLAVLAPDIETFWPLLRPYLQQEGIPANKAWLARAQSFPPLAVWLSHLRLRLNDVNSADLELTLYSEERPKMEYERFRVLLSRIYGAEDLVRAPSLQKDLQKGALDPKKPMNRDEFVAWALPWWNESHSDAILIQLMQKFFQETPAVIRIPAQSWLDYLERLSAKVEVEVEGLAPQGVICANISSAEWLALDGAFVLGLTDKALGPNPKTAIAPGEILSLANDLGFNLSHPEEAPQDWDARWLARQLPVPSVLSFSETDVSGIPETPSRLWLEAAKSTRRDFEQVSLPGTTRWDEIQLSKMEWIRDVRQWNPGRAQVMEDGILMDLGEKALPTFAAGLPFSLSATHLKNYFECPFIFAAGKVFKLSDVQALDLDLDPLTRGQLEHALLERLTADPWRAQWSQPEIVKIIEDLVVELKFEFGHPELARLMRNNLVTLAQRFLKMEDEWRRRFPQTRTVGRELKFQAKWSVQAKQLVAPDHPDEGPLVTGKVDRVDEGELQARVLLDYKSSAYKLTNFKSWLNNGNWQMGLYTLALERGFSVLGAAPVDGAFYFVLRTMDRSKGFAVEESQSQLFDVELHKSARLSREDRAQFLKQLEETMGELISQIALGQFAPLPRDHQICVSCDWRSLCRAPHLN